MTAFREHGQGPGDGGNERLDELTRRYREASAQEPRRPAPRVRDAVRAHAQAVLDARAATAPLSSAPPSAPARSAANQSRWKVSLLASIALAGLTSLIVLQFDRGSADEQAVALGDPPMREALPPPQATPPVNAMTPTTPQPAPLPAPSLADTAGQAVPPPQAPPDTPATKKRADAAKASPLGASEKSNIRVPAPTTGSIPTPAPVEPGPRRNTAPAPAPMAALSPAQSEAQAEAQAAPPAYPEAAEAQQNIAGQLSGRTSADVPPAAPPPDAASTTRPAPPAALARSRAATTGDIPQPPPRRSVTSTLPLASALQEAARQGHASRLNRLLVRGAPLNAADTAGHTPLMLAVINNHPAMVQRLLAAGANVALVDREGLTALQHARKLGRQRIVRMIEESS